MDRGEEARSRWGAVLQVDRGSGAEDRESGSAARANARCRSNPETNPAEISAAMSVPSSANSTIDQGARRDQPIVGGGCAE